MWLCLAFILKELRKNVVKLESLASFERNHNYYERINYNVIVINKKDKKIFIS